MRPLPWRAAPRPEAADLSSEDVRPGPPAAAGAHPGEPAIPDRARARWLAEEILPHDRAIRSWLRARCPAGLEPDDVLQETYAILAGLTGVDHITNPMSYAFQTAQSLVFRHLRRIRIVRMEPQSEVDHLVLVSEERSPEEQLAARQELRFFAEVIASLPAKCQEAFMLKRVDGLQQREVARRMGISESTVEKHMARAVRMILAAMAAPDSRLAHRTFFRSQGSEVDPADGDDPPAAEPRGRRPRPQPAARP